MKHLAPFFDASIWSGYGDDENSFFTIYRNLFARLAHDESFYNDTPLPSFGYPTWPWVPAAKGEEMTAARTFYNFWTNFATGKEFEWMEVWDLSTAPDRRVRRIMERDNKKAREDARREYNETVRSLALFIRKRDPRYKAHLARQAEANQAKASGSSTPRNADGSRTASDPAKAFVAQSWQDVEPSSQDDDIDWAVAENEDEEQWECVACGKSFRSEAAWNSHERSKKHLKEVERLKREMAEDDEELGLTGDADLSEPEEPPSRPPSRDASEVEPDSASDDSASTPAEGDPQANDVKLDPVTIDNGTLSAESGIGLVDSQDPAAKVGLHQQEIKRDDAKDPGLTTESPTTSGDAEPKPELSKREKRRAREAAKAQKSKEGSTNTQTCNVCKEKFESKTKLFNHIRDTGHALASPGTGKPAGASTGKKGKKGKR